MIIMQGPQNSTKHDVGLPSIANRKYTTSKKSQHGKTYYKQIFFVQCNNYIPLLMASKTTKNKYKLIYQNLKH